MIRSLAALVLLFVVLLSPTASHADRLAKGSSLVFVAVDGRTGEFANPDGFPIPLPRGEVGGILGFSRFMTDQWAFGVSAALGTSKLKANEFNLFGSVGSIDTYSTHSLTARIGADRYAFIDDNVAVYAGPGLMFARGRAQEEFRVVPPTVGGGKNKGPYTTQLGIDARIGLYARLTKSTAMFGQFGQAFSRTTADRSQYYSKPSWWATSPEGSIGIAFHP